MKLSFLTPFLILICHAFGSIASAQLIPSYDLGGASKPRPELRFRDANQYKRVHQSALRFILRGELDKTKKHLDQFLVENPGDAETMYMLAILHGQKGNITEAEAWMERAIDAGLPDDRLIAGPREVMKPLVKTDLFKRLNEKYLHKLVHGPLLGSVSATTASFWMRTSIESDVEVIVSSSETGKEVCRSKKTKSSASEDFTAVAVVDQLSAGTDYQYSIELNGKPCASGTFRTPAPAGEASKFVIAFGGGAGYVPENEKMWNTIGTFDPQAILLLGDNVYIDDPESVAMQQYTYHRRQSRPEWRKLTARSPVFTIWDDHDFSTNDSWGGAEVDKPFWKKDWVFPIFRQNWANPGYGGGDAQPGCWYSFGMGDVDFIMLDCRYYRTNPKESPRSMLGPVQKDWLKKQLAESNATFKVLVSSVPWDFRTKGKSFDTWNGYKEEHEEILSFIETQEIEGVLLMSADRHRSDAWKISRANGYDFYEFNSSRLTNQHIHPTMKKAGAIFSYNKPQSFGLVTFDTTVDDPEVTYEVVNIHGEKPHSITVKRSELQHDQPAQVELQREDGKVNVMLDGELFTTLDSKTYDKPILYPIYSPGQIAMTRDWPMKQDSVGESHDHPHHKSMWISHEISGIDFWAEKGGSVKTTSLETKFANASDNVVRTNSEWVKRSDGKTLLTDQTTYWFGGDKASRWINCLVNYRATHGDFQFDDTKEGLFAIRTHPDLRLNAKPSAGVKEVFGRAINSAGDSGKDVWGKPAKWMLYFGQINGKPVSIAMYDHPTNLRHPTTWHARDYGLVAANPFGMHHFLGKEKGAGAFKVKDGGTLQLRYRIEFFKGIATAKMIEEKFQDFSKETLPVLTKRKR